MSRSMLDARWLRFASASALIGLLSVSSPALADQSTNPDMSIDSATTSLSEDGENFDVKIQDVQRAEIEVADGPRTLHDNGFLYGEREFPVAAESIARAALGEHPGDIGPSSYLLSTPIEVSDANDVVIYHGFNYRSTTGEHGLVTVAAHTRAPLIGTIDEYRHLDTELPTLFLEDHGILQLTSDGYVDEDGTLVKDLTDRELAAARASLLDTDRFDLNEIEIETKLNLNNIARLAEVNPAEETVGKQYDGQTKPGYGSISAPTTYLKSRYGGTWTLHESKYLAMPSFTMDDIKSLANKPNDRNHCVPTAVTRMYSHARSKGFSNIPSNNASVYLTVRRVAANHGWTVSGGTNPTKINNIIGKSGAEFNYGKTSSKEIYVFSYPNTIRSEIDKTRPLLWNIASGTYSKHTVTVKGYYVYKRSNGAKARLVQVYDGWSASNRYIDYDAFIVSTVGSFNTIHVKK